METVDRTENHDPSSTMSDVDATERNEPDVSTVDDGIVTVDPPPETYPRPPFPVSGVGRSVRWRPVVPPWLRSWRELVAVLRWAVRFSTHTVAFHAVRVPVYALLLAIHSPRGVKRLAVSGFRWALDVEGHPLRTGTVEKNEPDLYLKLCRQRRDRVRLRVTLTLAGSGAIVIVGLVVTGSGVWWLRWGTLAVAVGLLGWLGTPADHPIAGPAVIVAKAQRLTADVVSRALGALGIAAINQALSKGPGVTFPAPISRDGPGWRAEIDLPYGVTVTDIMERRERLASGLRRPVGCVWPEPATEEHAGRLVLWVADQDLSRTPARPWPLAARGRTDVFEPVPFGFDQRGQSVTVLLVFASVLIGAMPRYGKTFALRILLLACALDPRVQLRVFDFKGTGDHSTMERIAHHYASGAATPAALEACLVSLRQLVTVELVRRAEVIERLPRDICPESKITPELAARPSLGLAPIVLAIDECQELFSHPDYGAEAESLCVAAIKRGPALGIITMLATQRPDAKSLPTGVSDNVGIRYCLRVMGHQANDMVLGTGAHKNGIRATLFNPKDRGIGLLVGNADDPQIVRTAYIDAPTADRITLRAHALRAAAGTLTGHATGTNDLTADAAPAVSLVDDAASVTRADEPKVWLETLADRLAELRPDVYGTWATVDGETKARQLSAALKPYGLTIRQVWVPTPDGQGLNRRGVHRADVLTAVHAKQQRQSTRTGNSHPAPSRPPARPSRPTSHKKRP